MPSSQLLSNLLLKNWRGCCADEVMDADEMEDLMDDLGLDGDDHSDSRRRF